MVTELAIQNENFQQRLATIRDRQAPSGVEWFDALRNVAFERFNELGLPSVKDEEWKYTNVAPIGRMDLSPIDAVEPASVGDLASIGTPETRHSQLVFLNGQFRSDLSNVSALPDNLVAIDLAAAVADSRYSEIVREHLGRQADHVAQGFVALNTAMMTSGALVLIPKGLKVEAPIALLFVSDGTEAATFPRVLVVAEENSSALILEGYGSPTETTQLTNAAVELVIKDGARLEHYKVQRESLAAFHIATTVADLGRNASYDATTITFGAQLSRHDIHVTMAHEGAECWVDGLYLTGDGQHADTHSLIDHRKPHCTSHQLYKGILDGKSRAVFNGKVFVRHDAQKTDAMQTNKNLLLSNEARVDTKPQLEIWADDVKCAHGAAVGQISEDELFYLETRGIHPDLGKNLLTYGFAEEVIQKIKIDSIRAELDEALLNRLNARLEV